MPVRCGVKHNNAHCANGSHCDSNGWCIKGKKYNESNIGSVSGSDYANPAEAPVAAPAVYHNSVLSAFRKQHEAAPAIAKETPVVYRNSVLSEFRKQHETQKKAAQVVASKTPETRWCQCTCPSRGANVRAVENKQPPAVEEPRLSKSKSERSSHRRRSESRRRSADSDSTTSETRKSSSGRRHRHHHEDGSRKHHRHHRHADHENKEKRRSQRHTSAEKSIPTAVPMIEDKKIVPVVVPTLAVIEDKKPFVLKAVGWPVPTVTATNSSGGIFDTIKRAMGFAVPSLSTVAAPKGTVPSLSTVAVPKMLASPATQSVIVTTKKERTDHRCGPTFENSKCDAGRCCSVFGFCGNQHHCGIDHGYEGAFDGVFQPIATTHH